MSEQEEQEFSSPSINDMMANDTSSIDNDNDMGNDDIPSFQNDDAANNEEEESVLLANNDDDVEDEESILLFQHTKELAEIEELNREITILQIQLTLAESKVYASKVELEQSEVKCAQAKADAITVKDMKERLRKMEELVLYVGHHLAVPLAIKQAAKLAALETKEVEQRKEKYLNAYRCSKEYLNIQASKNELVEINAELKHSRKLLDNLLNKRNAVLVRLCSQWKKAQDAALQSNADDKGLSASPQDDDSDFIDMIDSETNYDSGILKEMTNSSSDHEMNESSAFQEEEVSPACGEDDERSASEYEQLDISDDQMSNRVDFDD